MTRHIPTIHSVYRHYKGPLYYVMSLAGHTEREETLVIYHALYADGDTYARPLDMFTSEVPEEDQKYNITGQKYRFELMDGGTMTTLKEDILKAIEKSDVIEEVSSEQNAYYVDGDLEALIKELGATHFIKGDYMTVTRHHEQIDFQVEYIPSRFWENDKEMIVSFN